MNDYSFEMELYLAHKVEGGQIFLDEQESHHCIKVMRHKNGDVLQITDGKGKRYSATLKVAERRSCILEIESESTHLSASTSHLHLAIAPTKNIDRFEWLLEKATEIGIDEITPIICSRSERIHFKQERMNKLIVSAMKQSMRSWLPILNAPIKFNELINLNTSSESSSDNIFKAIFHCQLPGLPLLKHTYVPKSNVLILIGPEGDFTTQEIQIAEANNFIALSLGVARLRTETAGLIAVNIIQLLND